MTQQRSFAVKTNNLSTAPILLDDGAYAAQITNAAIEGKEGKQFINIVPERTYIKDKKEWVETGAHIIEGSIFYGVVLTSKKAINKLQRDEPKIFGGQIRLSFDKETFMFQDNHVLGATLEALGYKEQLVDNWGDFSSNIDFVYNDDIEVPEELQNVENIVHMLNGLVYARALFSDVVQLMNGRNCRAIIAKQANFKNPSQVDNIINCGNYSSACGILSYVEGCENDLEVEG
jgi:hypothetical protein